jgi:Zn-dependent peptidase ImmA (M78 family)
MRLRQKKIEQLVESLLAAHRVKHPPVQVEEIAKKIGLEVERHAFNKNEFSGILVRDGGRAVLGVNSSHHLNRQRFTIAHEIGHFLLHEGDRVFVDRTYNVSFRNSVSSQGTDLEEIEANTFASLLLIPEEFLANDPDAQLIDMEDEDTIKRLARKYQVSPQAMTLRLINRLQRF